MAEAAAATREAEELSLQIEGRSRDLLLRFMTQHDRREEAVSGDSSDIELNLGLSLGGRFGTDPKDKRLLRSSSIAGLETLPRDLDIAPPPAVLLLNRTCSLPTETEEEWRKRKEMQSLRRLEAKRKRSEKHRNFRPVKDRASLEREVEEDKQREEEGLTALSLKGGKVSANGFLCSSAVLPPPVGGLLPSWVNGKSSVFGNSVAMHGFSPSSQGSQGSSSSGVSDMDSRLIQGSSNCMEAKSPGSIQSLPDGIEQKVVITASTDEKSMKPKPATEREREMEMERNVMEEMPCVSTRGDGPNGRRIEGFLYKYRKGEEVRIVCVCHGSFLSPAEFVRHAGGGDVAHPLRHIVVNPSSSLL